MQSMRSCSVNSNHFSHVSHHVVMWELANLVIMLLKAVPSLFSFSPMKFTIWLAKVMVKSVSLSLSHFTLFTYDERKFTFKWWGQRAEDEVQLGIYFPSCAVGPWLFASEPTSHIPEVHIMKDCKCTWRSNRTARRYAFVICLSF